MMAKVLATAQPEAAQALDINLSCITRVFRPCAGMKELAPSAWENQASVAPEFDGLEFGPWMNPAGVLVVFVGAFVIVMVLVQRK